MIFSIVPGKSVSWIQLFSKKMNDVYDGTRYRTIEVWNRIQFYGVQVPLPQKRETRTKITLYIYYLYI